MGALLQHTGDLFASDDTLAIGHGVNTAGIMGAGVAKIVRARFPGTYREYRAACVNGILEPGGCHTNIENGRVIYNCASQQKLGADAQLHWLVRSVDLALADAVERRIVGIAIPRIGCGIGGLQWSEVEPALEELVTRHDADLHVFTL